jgi:hypothetical protein
MTLVNFDIEVMDALSAARVALVVQRDWESAYVLDEFLARCRAARHDEILEVVKAELTERKGRLRVVEG